MSKPDDEVPFLSRWSRMKQRAAHPGLPAEQVERDGVAAGGRQAATSPAVAPPAADVMPAKNAEAEPPLDLEKLPRVEELTAESNIAVFLDRRVPAALRNAALSRMWTLDPTIRDFIEVAENQWNWNIPGGAPFYELIEEGSTAGISFADATSAISRTLTSPDNPPPPTEQIAEKPDEIPDQQKVDPGGEVLAAPQEIALPLHTSSVGHAAPSPLAAQDVRSTEADLTAVQQSAHPTRRRHGGALPA